MDDRFCASSSCKVSLENNRKHAKYCSRKCKDRAHKARVREREYANRYFAAIGAAFAKGKKITIVDGTIISVEEEKYIMKYEY